MTAERWDAVVVGAGAAGLFCAALAGQRGLRVLAIDHSARVAEKIRISGGGRCNFTNLHASPANFLSDNPHFCRSALARYLPSDFIALLARHRIAWHEKHRGQLFCDESSENIIDLLLAECAAGGVARWQPCAVRGVAHGEAGFLIDTDRGAVAASNLVIATGGLSIPQIGASDFAYRLARQFGHRIVEPRPALVPLTFDAARWAPFAALSGVSLEARVAVAGDKARKAEFTEDLLFTHRGLSGPAALQISSYWRPGGELRIDLSPGARLGEALVEAKARSPRRQLGNELATLLPARLAAAWLHADTAAAQPLADLRDRDLHRLGEGLHGWTLAPDGTYGFRKAEVTVGGVDTREIDSQTMASRRLPGLHFIGEALDVTGWLGGYNFQWAWASAAACARGLAAGKG